MPVFHPTTAAQLASRDRMLAAALRPDAPATAAIGREYPLVLAPAGARFSYCLGDGDEIVAHANLWPRVLGGSGLSAGLAVGLVGNVATDERRRGQGLMRSLLSELRDIAVGSGLRALVLWSDLLGFYQKLGFQSCGRERRYGFSAGALPAAGAGAFRPLRGAERHAAAEAMLAGRYPVARTLERSVGEFQALLQIPGMTVVRAPAPGAYAVLGKGADMVGVVHEWGAASPEQLLAAIRAAAAAAGFAEVLLLAPAALPPAWDAALRAAADVVEEHPMALAWTADEAARELLAESFIWGLDSI